MIEDELGWGGDFILVEKLIHETGTCNDTQLLRIQLSPHYVHTAHRYMSVVNWFNFTLMVSTLHNVFVVNWFNFTLMVSTQAQCICG